VSAKAERDTGVHCQPAATGDKTRDVGGCNTHYHDASRCLSGRWHFLDRVGTRFADDTEKSFYAAERADVSWDLRQPAAADIFSRMIAPYVPGSGDDLHRRESARRRRAGPLNRCSCRRRTLAKSPLSNGTSAAFPSSPITGVRYDLAHPAIRRRWRPARALAGGARPLRPGGATAIDANEVAMGSSADVGLGIGAPSPARRSSSLPCRVMATGQRRRGLAVTRGEMTRSTCRIVPPTIS